MEAVAAVASVASVIDIAVRCVSSLAAIRRRYKSVATDIELLEGHIVTVRLVLEQISALVQETLDVELHHELILNLSISTNCCKLMLATLEQQFLALDTCDDGLPNFESRVKFALRSQATTDCVQRLGSLISALHCIVSVFHVRNVAGQKELLEQAKVKRVFKEIQDDSTSLVVLFDSASLASERTITTTATSKLSVGFGFDDELLQHPNYKSTFRSLIRRARSRTLLTPDSKELRGKMSHMAGSTVSVAGTITQSPPKDGHIPVNMAEAKDHDDHVRKESRIVDDNESTETDSDVELVIQSHKPEPTYVFGAERRRSTVNRDALTHRLYVQRYLAAKCLSALEEPCILPPSEVVACERHRSSLRHALQHNHFQRDARNAVRWCTTHEQFSRYIIFPESQFVNDVERVLGADYPLVW